MGSLESDTTEQLHFHFSFSCIGEGNGNPLQYSCLENPRDGEAWWAAIYGVAQSWTWLKRLSSSSSSSSRTCNLTLGNPVSFLFKKVDNAYLKRWLWGWNKRIFVKRAQSQLVRFPFLWSWFTFCSVRRGLPPAPYTLWEGAPRGRSTHRRNLRVNDYVSWFCSFQSNIIWGEGGERHFFLSHSFWGWDTSHDSGRNSDWHLRGKADGRHLH